MAAPAALAQDACETYSGGCAGTGEVGGTTEDAGSGVSGNDFRAPAETGGASGGASSDVPASTSSPRTLPFTGGEFVLAAALGLGAVTVGAGFVVAGRRRLQPSQ